MKQQMKEYKNMKKNNEKTLSQKLIESYYHYHGSLHLLKEQEGLSDKTVRELEWEAQKDILRRWAQGEEQRGAIRYEEYLGFCRALEEGKTPNAFLFACIAGNHNMMYPGECETKAAYQTPEIKE